MNGNCNCLHPQPGGCAACRPSPPAVFNNITARPPILCPVCLGKQRVPQSFYPVNEGEASLNREFVDCRTCKGRGIV